jgi:hypothetical protein
MEGILMSRSDDRNVVAEVDRFIGAVGAGTLKPSETARQMRSLLEALCFYATVSNYDEQQILERGRIYFVCPMEEDDRGDRARAALTNIGLKML